MKKSFTTLIFLVVLHFGAQASAQTDYPAKPIHIVVTSTPGGAADTLARLVGQKFSEAWGQPTIIDNKPGSGGRAPEGVARAPADGYTLLLAAAGFMTISPSIFANLAYDPVKDFAPVSLIVKAPLLLVIHPSVPAKTVTELIDYGKKNPGKLNVGHGAPGSAQHLGSVFFASVAGIDVLQVPYKGSMATTTGLLAGSVDVQFDNMVTFIPYVKSGKLRALGVASAKRVSIMPDVPTISESGLPGFETGTWYGIVAPANTPAAVIEKLNREIVRSVALPELQEKLQSQGLEPFTNSPREYASLIQADIQKYANIVKKAGLRLE